MFFVYISFGVWQAAECTEWSAVIDLTSFSCMVFVRVVGVDVRLCRVLDVWFGRAVLVHVGHFFFLVYTHTRAAGSADS